MNLPLTPQSGDNRNQNAIDWSNLFMLHTKQHQFVDGSPPPYSPSQPILEMCLNQLANGVLVCNVQGKILFMNDAAKHLVAPHLDAIKLDTVSSALGRVCYPSGEVMPLEEWSLSRALRGEKVTDREERIVRPDGSFSDILVSGTPLYDHQGAVVAAITTCIDITERKRVEEHLRSIARFPAENPNPILRVSHSGAILYANEASQSILKCLDCESGESLPDAWCEIVTQALQSRQSQAFDLDCAGKTFYFQMVPLPDHDCVNLYGCDITDRKQAEEQIRRSQEDLNRAQAVAHTGSWRLDVQHNELRWSDETYRMFGIPTGTALTYEAFLASVHPEDREDVDQAWTAALHGKPYDIEHRIVVGEEVKWVHERAELDFDQQGNLQGGFGTVQDITASKQAAEALRQSEQRLRAMFDNAALGIVEVNDEGRFTAVNNRICQILGYSCDELLQMNVHDLTAPEDRKLSDELNARLHRGEFDLFDYEKRYLKRDGSPMWVHVTVSAVRALNGDFIRAIGTIEDISERKRAEETLYESRKKLELLFELLPVGVSVLDHENKLVVQNPALEKILDITHEGLLRGDYRSRRYLRGDGTSMIAEEFPSARVQNGEAEVCDVEIGVVKENGDLIWTSVSATACPLLDWKVVIVTTDITKRKEMEVALRESEERYRALFVNTHEIIAVSEVIFDEQGRVVDGIFRDVNPRWEQFIGKPAAEVIGKRMIDVFGSEAMQAAIARCQQVMDTGETIQSEAYFPWNDTYYLTSGFRLYDNLCVTSSIEITALKRTEKALRESEARFRQLADSMPQLVWTVRPDGVVDYYNQRYEEFDGIKLQTNDWWELTPLLHPDDRQPTVDAWQHAFETGEQYQVTHRIYRADGSWRWYLSRAIPIRDDEGRIVQWYGTATDIHEQKMAEQRTALLQQLTAELSVASTIEAVAAVVVNRALQAVGGHVGSIVLLTPDGIAVDLIDTAGMSAEVSRPFRRMALDYPVPLTDAVRVGVPVWIETQEEYIRRYPAAAPIVINQTGSHATACLPLIIEERVIGGFGISFAHPIVFSREDQAFLISLAQQCAQAIERARLYEIVQQERDKLQTILDNMVEEVWVSDTDGNMTLMNLSTSNILEFSEEQASSQPLSSIISKDEYFKLDGTPRTEEDTLSFRALRRGETVRNETFMVRHANTGELRYRQGSAAPIRNESGEIVGAVTVVRDITDQKRAEQQALDLLAERERTRALAEFVQNVSHDFRTPLSTLKTSLYLLSKFPEPGKQQRQIEIMARQTERIADLLETVTTMTRLDSQTRLELELVDLNQLVQAVYLEMHPAASQKGVIPILDLTEEAIKVAADEVELKRALTEIMKNAIQFTPEGGTITLRTNHQAEGATVEIEDTGIGIADTELPYIFDRLYRVDKARSANSGGSGLGLALAQKIITLHGGILGVMSTLDAGSTFQITLPLSR